jgi:hypothetical protein
MGTLAEFADANNGGAPSGEAKILRNLPAVGDAVATGRCWHAYAGLGHIGGLVRSGGAVLQETLPSL